MPGLRLGSDKGAHEWLGFFDALAIGLAAQRALEERDARMIIVGSHGEGALRVALLG